MKLNDGVMLITYPDSLGRNLAELELVLERFFPGSVAGLHILPFYPSSGDRGFSPTRYDVVSPEFGSWNDLARLSGKYYLMYDFMINHLSAESFEFRDFIDKKDDSPYAGMFIRYRDFWPGGEPSEEDIARIYKRKPRAPYIDVHFRDGTGEKVWCTFGDDQIDLDLRNEAAWRFIEENLRTLSRRGAAVIRLDAVAYATKKAGTACFFEEPEIWDIMERVRSILSPHGVEILPEVHEHYSLQMKMAAKGYRVYDFALPMLLLDALRTGDPAYLVSWLRICPRNQFTTLDTHDGIGVLDARDLLPDDRVQKVKDNIFSNDNVVKRIHSSPDYHSLDVYQVNCTYYSALGNDDDACLAARAVQMFAPGIPQVYYVGLLAGKNDVELVEKTKNGRDINRHGYTLEDIERECERPVVQKILKLLRFRNEFPAFGGNCEAHAEGSVLTIERTGGGCSAVLTADVKTHALSIRYSGLDGKEQALSL